MLFRKLTVVEGSYSCHPILAAEYDLTIFLTCSWEEQKRRLQIREGNHFSAFEDVWIPMEENYLQHYSIETGSHLIVDTCYGSNAYGGCIFECSSGDHSPACVYPCAHGGFE